MSYLNISENLFIGTNELSIMQNFCNQNFYKIIGLISKNYGFIEDKDLNNILKISDSEKNCFKASSPGPLQLQFHSPSYAFSYPDKMITWDRHKIITISDSYKNKNLWIKISYKKDYIEEGTLTIDNKGNVTGTGTSFSKKLRGEPGFPSRLTLYTFDGESFSPKGIYYVSSVNSDTSLLIYSDTGMGDTLLTYYYAVNGTFPEGSLVTSDEEFPFRYDSCQITLVEETIPTEIPNELIMKDSNTEFYVARISVDENGIISIQDKRSVFEDLEERYSKWWKSK